MPVTKTIPGIQRGPDFDREVHDPAKIEQVEKAARLHRQPEANDPIVEAAVTALEEVKDTFGRNLDIQYETNSGMIVMTLYDSETGEEIRKIPPEEAIRMAQYRKHMRARYMDGVL
jgi:uncharacterized FlaG/YvyC family protein